LGIDRQGKSPTEGNEGNEEEEEVLKRQSRKRSPVGPNEIVRHGWAVQISRDDGSNFLALGAKGVLPVVFAGRTWAVAHKKELREHNFRCRVVPVTFTDVRISDQGK